jgi:hypothetical protein
MKSNAEMIEGPEAWDRFNALVNQVLTVPHSVIMQREAEYKRRSKANPNRRGPKPKAKPSASDRAADAR